MPDQRTSLIADPFAPAPGPRPFEIGPAQPNPTPGDEPPTPFSFRSDRIALPQVPCHITYTNPRTHEIIRGGLDRSPLFSGKIKSRGPRYCPSIEDKVVRFADRDRHQIFLEPEGLETV